MSTSQPDGAAEGSLEITAFTLEDGAPSIVPASVRRQWIDDTSDRFATRCLPMMMANQYGWFILNTHEVRLTWSGAREREALVVEYRNPAPDKVSAISMFGHGIVTWSIPILFRTPGGFDLWVRGPANYPRPDIYPLEGIVEADWSAQTFTMNWIFLRTGVPTIVKAGEPICMVTPIRRSDLERFGGVIRSIDDDPELAAEVRHWSSSRSDFLFARDRHEFQLDYLRGRTAQGAMASSHRTRVRLPRFVDRRDTGDGPGN